VLHRIVRKRRGRDGKLMFQTMGDAVARYDSPVSGEEILGRVCRIEKNGTGKRTTDMDSFFQRRMNSLIAAILFIRSEAYGTFSLVMGMARAVL
jgi:hypothetical protein